MVSKPASVEFFAGFAPRPHISHVVFDCDGTISWLRHGWPRVMFELFRSFYPPPNGQSQAEIEDLLMSEILSRNGQPSIYQMIAFHKRMEGMGAACPSPEQLLQHYQSRLDGLIAERTAGIQRGAARPDDYVVFGARAFLDNLRRRNLTLVVLSGTLQERVREECSLLGLSDYFGRHIYGSTPDPTQFSKKQVIARLLREEQISGGSLLSFGDGPVEIHETKLVGGIAIAVASDEEHNGSGRMYRWKRDQLLQAGADAVMADYREAPELMEILTGS